MVIFELWVWAVLAAALVQTVRFSLQKSLKGAGLTSAGATFSRFLFAAPLAAALAGGMIWSAGNGMPAIGAQFWLMAAIGGLAQIGGTLAVVALFSERNFAVGVAFTKSEIVLVAVFSAVFLGEPVSVAGFLAILVGVLGVLALSLPATGGGFRLLNRASALGLAGGAVFGISAVGYRGATQALDGAPLLRAAITLAAVTVFQTLVMALWLRLRQPGEVTRVLARWRMTALVGITGMLGSLGWFLAFALQNAAYVRALGQVELVFSILGGWLVFGERIRGRELIGIALLGLSIVMIVALV